MGYMLAKVDFVSLGLITAGLLACLVAAGASWKQYHHAGVAYFLVTAALFAYGFYSVATAEVPLTCLSTAQQVGDAFLKCVDELANGEFCGQTVADRFCDNYKDRK